MIEGVGTLVRLSVPDAAEGNSLYAWLSEAEVGEVTAPPPPPGQMGAFDVVDVLLTHATGLSGLAVAVATWIGTRRTPPAVTFTRPDGAKLTIAAGAEPDPELIEKFLRGGDAQA